MSDPRSLLQLRRARRRAESNAFYLAGVLVLYQEAEGMSDVDLARYLGCAQEDLVRLALCRRPGLAPPLTFADDIASLARRFSLSGERLAVLVRHADFLRAMRAGTPEEQETRVLQAAQDREEEESPPAPERTAEGEAGSQEREQGEML
jgi:hypothetical protein